MTLLDKRLVLVTGKGGVGRTTVAAALAVAAGKKGLKACVVELSGMASVPPLFGLQGRSFEFRRATDNVWVWSLTVEDCLDEFGRRKLRLPGLMRRVLRSRATRTFVDAIPGLHDLLQLGKIENLLSEPLPSDPHFDLMVVDAPATGHGLTLLSAASSMTEVSKAGPFYDLAEVIDAYLRDGSRTGVALVTLPEALPVAESAELLAALDELGMPAAAVIANRCTAPPLPEQVTMSTVQQALADLSGGAELLGLVGQAQARAHAQTEALGRLDASIGDTPLLRLPEERAAASVVKALGASLAEAL
jgi:anion-transporting  ArsA/GET3 family ATPase